MTNKELLDQIKTELFGTVTDGEATEDGFLIKLRNGKYDAEQYERLYSLFAKVNEKIVEKDDILADTMCYYTEFVSKLVLHLKTAENPQLPEITADLTGLFGSK